MALVRYQKPQILVPISDAIVNGTVVKRKVRFENMTYAQSPQGEWNGVFIDPGMSTTSVSINLTVVLFAAGPVDPDTGETTYGERLEGRKMFNDYAHSLIANNTTLVDNLTGDVLVNYSEYADAVRMSQTTGVDLELLLPEALKGKDFIPEGDFFRRMSEMADVKVDSVITQYIINANENNRFTY